MTTNLNEFIFSDDPDNVSIVNETLVPIDIDTTEVLVDASDTDTFGGNDTIIAVGNYDVVLVADLEVLPQVIPSNFTSAVAIQVDDSVFALGDRNDTVIGAVQLITPVYSDAEAVGIRGWDDADINLGSGSDLIAGLASGVGANAYGIKEIDIETGSGNDIVVGGAVVQGINPQYGAAGIVDTNIFLDSGSDIVAGVAVVTTGPFSSISMAGISNSNIYSSREDAPGGDVVIGVALGVVADDGPYEGPLNDIYGPSYGMYDSYGIYAGALDLYSTQSADIVVGIVAFGSLASGSGFTYNAGAFAGHGINTGGGNDIVVGVAYAELGENSYFAENSGIFGSVNTGGGNDIVVGAVIGSMDNGGGAFGNAGIGGVERFTSIDTGDGADIVVGIVDIAAGWETAVMANTGILVDGDINTGDQNDVLIGLSQPLSGSGFKGDNYGIAAASTIDTGPEEPGPIEYPVVAEVESPGFIYLGGGDDFVYARGPSGGINGVIFYGESGNDVFDIQSGFGKVFGGADTDTLVLAGNFDEYFFDDPEAPADDLADVEGGVWIGSEINRTEIYAEGVEFFQFADGIKSYDQLFEELLSA